MRVSFLRALLQLPVCTKSSFGSLAFLCTLGIYCTLSPFFRTFSTVVLNCQIKAHQAECVKATEGVLKDLLATQDQEVLHLLKEAAEQERGKFYPVHGMYLSSDLCLHSPEMGTGTYYIVL